jgi:hypothetical protein
MGFFKKLLSLWVILWLGSCLLEAEVSPAEKNVNSSSTVILNTHSFWRCYLTLKPSLYGTSASASPPSSRTYSPAGTGTHTLTATQPDLPYPPADWMQIDFDDSEWWRHPAPFPSMPFDPDRTWNHYGDNQPIGLALICARGKFTVTDLTEVKELKISCMYRGGIVVYLNGKEVLRNHMPAGEIKMDTLAEDYPAEISILPDVPSHRPEFRAEYEKKVPLRIRKVENVSIPVTALRKGMNVLAIEIHRTAMTPTKYPWNQCALISIELTAEGRGIVQNITRPSGVVQVWNADLLADVTDVDYGDPHERLKPVKIVGTRGGVFTGQFVVSSDKSIRGLNVDFVELRHESGKAVIPAVNVCIYYPRLEISVSNQNPRYPWKGTWKPIGCNIGELRCAGTLANKPPSEVPVVRKQQIQDGYPYIWGAVQPVWVSITIPRNAPAGIWKGTLKLTMEDITQAMMIPVELKVCSWLLPEPRDFVFFMDFVQSPDGLASHYKVPMWSDRHWQLIDRTFEMLGEVGNKTLYIPVITPTHFGNSETMIRWIEDSDGKFKYDFSIAEKYLDIATRRCGKPRVVCLYAWDVYLGGTVHRYTGGMGEHAKKWKENTTGVTKVDKTGKSETMMVPVCGDEAKKLWLPWGQAVLEFAKRHALEDRIMIGIAGDIRPSKEQVEFWKEILPGIKWVAQGHDRADDLHGVPVGYSSSIFGCSFAVTDPEIKRWYGWQRPSVTTYFPRVFRDGHHGWTAGLYMRLVPEWNISGWQNGVGRVTADFFGGVIARDPKTFWGNAGLRNSWLTPGPNGVIPTAEYIFLREGIQECEARIFLEKVLQDETTRHRIGEELATHCQKVLDERTRYIMWVFDLNYVNYNTSGCMIRKPLDLNWYAGSGWRERSARLFEIAGEVARIIGK